jgi:putative membrane protein
VKEREMSENGRKHVLRGMVAGAGAGLAAAWAMNVFMAGPGEKLHEGVESDEEKANQRVQQMQREQSGEPREDATMKAADAIVATATGGRHLSREDRQKAGPVVHYAFGAVMGGLYGGLAEYSDAVKSGMGTAFGTVLFAGADLVAVPALRLSAPLKEYPASSFASPLAAHLVYGATTELLRRAVRAIL